MFRHCIFACFLLSSAHVNASQTQITTISGYDELAQGTFEKTSLRADGSVTLAPITHTLADDLPGPLLAMRKVSDGVFWVSAIGPGTIYEVSSGSKTKMVFESDKALITSIVKLQSGLIAATSAPNGGVHLFNGRGAKASKFLAVNQMSFIFAAASFGDDLYLVGGGDEGGQLLKMHVSSGKVTKLASISESHASAIFIAPQSSGPEIYFGGSDLGTVYRYKAGKVESIYSGPAAEVSSIVVDKKGRVFAAFIDSGARLALPSAPAPSATPSTPDNTFQNWWHRNIQFSRVVMLEERLAPSVIWESRQEGVFALHLDDAHSRVFAGTGMYGRVLELHTATNLRADILYESEHAAQVIAFDNDSQGRFVTLAAGVGAIFAFDPDKLMDEGFYKSQVFDAGGAAHFGAILVDNKKDPAAAQWRVGNTPHPDNTWGPFGDTARFGRFAQFRFKLTRSHAPQVSQFRSSFLTSNQPPVIKDVRLLQPGQRLSMGESFGGAQAVTLDENAFHTSEGRYVFGPQGAPALNATLSFVPNFRSVYVVARDADADLLRYRFVLEKMTDKGDVAERKLIKDWDFEPFVSFDAAAAGEGRYRIAVSVDDFHTNGPKRMLADHATSEIFSLATALPEFSHIKARVNGEKTHVSFSVAAKVPLALVQCASADGKWFSVDSTDEIVDQNVESFDLVLDFIPAFGSLTCQASDVDQNVRKIDIKVAH